MHANRVLVASAIVLLSGCVSTQSVGRTTGITPATAEQVEACTYLDDLTGVSGMYGVFADRGIENARQKMMEKAASIGATHVVWAESSASYGSSSAGGKAYRCPQ